jgi:plastocyanin
MRPILRNIIPAIGLCLVSACGGSEPASTTPATGAASETKATGQIITVQLITDEKGSYFSPSTIDASRGDVIRFTLKSGVHNVSFPHDSNSIKEGLPKSSDFLQIPGQEYDLLVSMRPGSYYFHCDPHAALGMKGQLNIK